MQIAMKKYLAQNHDTSGGVNLADKFNNKYNSPQARKSSVAPTSFADSNVMELNCLLTLFKPKDIVAAMSKSTGNNNNPF